MTRLIRIGRIAAVTYSCDIATERGLCKASPGELFRHEWKAHHPILAATQDKSNYYILCKINFKDGGLLDGFKTGIDDYAGSSPSCDIAPVMPNPDAVDIVGELKLVEMTDGKKNYAFSGAILCVSKSGDHLYVMDKRDAKHIKDVLPNPPVPAPAGHGDVAAMAGRAYWEMAHGFARLYDPSKKALARDVLVGGVQRFPCPTCRNFGVAHLKDHPLDFTSRESLNHSLWKFHNAVNKHLNKPEYPWAAVLASLPATVCPLVVENPKSTKSGLILYGSKFCVHCQRSLAAAKKAGVPVVYVETTTGKGKLMAEKKGITAVPFVEKVEDGAVVKEHVGEMTVADWKAFA
jgi:glutaredoxin